MLLWVGTTFVTNTYLLYSFMSDKAAKAEAKIKRLAESVGSTPDGIAWMESALDPFPDENRKIAGYPDSVLTKSVVQTFRQTTTCKAPATAPSGNWDLNVFFDGHFISYPMYSTTQIGGDYSSVFHMTQSGPAYFSGGVVCRSAPAGSNLTLDTSNGFLVPTVDTNVPYRIISTGMEIVNTTAPLNKQGTLITWRGPSVEKEPATATFVTGSGAIDVVAGSSRYWLKNKVPSTGTQALILQGSREWAAEDGAYIVGVRGTPDMPQRCTSPDTHAFLSEQDANGVWASGLFAPSGIDGRIVTPDAYLSHTGFNSFGAYMRGLSQETTIDVIWHYTIERFPNFQYTDLVTMATNSPSLDNRILELYSKTAWHIPTGCRLNENAFGDFIMDCANLLEEFGVPGMPYVRKAMGVVNKINYDSGSRTKAPERELVFQPQQTSKPKIKAKPLQTIPKTQSKPLPPIPKKK